MTIKHTFSSQVTPIHLRRKATERYVAHLLTIARPLIPPLRLQRSLVEQVRFLAIPMTWRWLEIPFGRS